jgi:hypothetical protein
MHLRVSCPSLTMSSCRMLVAAGFSLRTGGQHLRRLSRLKPAATPLRGIF